MTVVDCSSVPCSRPAVLGSGYAPASPGMPPGGPGLTGPERIRAASGGPALALELEEKGYEWLKPSDEENGVMVNG